MEDYYIINNLEDPNYDAILKLAWPCSGYRCQQRINDAKTEIAMKLPEGDTAEHPILDPYQRFTKVGIQAYIAEGGWEGE